MTKQSRTKLNYAHFPMLPHTAKISNLDLSIARLRGSRQTHTWVF